MLNKYRKAKSIAYNYHIHVWYINVIFIAVASFEFKRIFSLKMKLSVFQVLLCRVCNELLDNLGPVLSAFSYMNLLFYSDSNIAFTGFSATATAGMFYIFVYTVVIIQEMKMH